MFRKRHVQKHSPGKGGTKLTLSILFVIWQFFPVVGGAEVRALREARALQARGYQVRVLTLRLKRSLAVTEEIEGVPVQRIGGLFVRGRLRLRFGAQWITEWLLWRELLRSRHTYDLVHLRQFSGLARPAALAALLTGKPLFVRLACASPAEELAVRVNAETTLCPGPLDPSLPFLRVKARSWVSGDISMLWRSQRLAGFTLWLLKRCGALFTAISTRIWSELQGIGFRTERIAFLPNGIDLEHYEESRLCVTRRLTHQSVRTQKVICVSRLTFQKGQDVLIQAWRQVHAVLPDAKLLLVGGGKLRPSLEALAAALELSECIEFVDLVQDARPFLAEADLFVLASRFEGMPNALLEAMACGLPCVATRVSGTEDVIIDGESGLLVPPGDPDGLARALLALLTNRDRARAYGAAAWKRVQQLFQDDMLIEHLLDLYRFAVGWEHRSPPSGGLQDDALVSSASEKAPLLSRPMRISAKSEE